MPITPDMPQYAVTQIKKINDRIKQSCSLAGRSSQSVTLIGASKRQDASLLTHFFDKGLRHLGENYLQEAIQKKTNLSKLDLTWHFIGQVQSNKTKIIAENFNWVHGVDRIKIAQRLGQQNPNKALTNSDINILIQLNLDDEMSKGGVTLNEASKLCDEIAQIQGIKLRGFMMIPKARESETEQRGVFAQAKDLLENINQQYGLAMDSLSMGMSNDLETAIAEGSTMVRIGTDLFGARV